MPLAEMLLVSTGKALGVALDEYLLAIGLSEPGPDFDKYFSEVNKKLDDISARCSW